MKIDELYRMALDGDEATQARLFEKLSARFRLFAHQRIWHKENAEEVVQEALMTVFQEYKNVDIEISFVAWTHKIIENKLLAYIQSQRRQFGRTVPLSDTHNPEASGQPDMDLRFALIDCLKKISKINSRYARILNLHLQGHDREEVCQMLDLTVKNSYVVMSRARSLLEHCLKTGDATE